MEKIIVITKRNNKIFYSFETKKITHAKRIILNLFKFPPWVITSIEQRLKTGEDFFVNQHIKKVNYKLEIYRIITKK